MADERFQDFPQKTNPSGSDELVGVDGLGYFRSPVSSLPSGGGEESVFLPALEGRTALLLAGTGQSNLISDQTGGTNLAVNSNVKFWNGTTWVVPDMSQPVDTNFTAGVTYTGYMEGNHACPMLAMAVEAQQDTGLDVYVVQTGRGGATIDEFAPMSGDVMNEFTSQLTSALASSELATANVDAVDAFVWMQGGTSVRGDYGAIRYRDDLLAIKSYLSDGWGSDYSHFVVGDTAYAGTTAPNNWQGWNLFDQVTNENSYSISSIGIAVQPDGVHFTVDGATHYGKRMCNAMLRGTSPKTRTASHWVIDGNSTPITGPYIRRSDSDTAPSAGQWRLNSAGTNLLISKLDSNSGTPTLGQIGYGESITLTASTTGLLVFVVETVTDETTYWEFTGTPVEMVPYGNVAGVLTTSARSYDDEGDVILTSAKAPKIGLNVNSVDNLSDSAVTVAGTPLDGFYSKVMSWKPSYSAGDDDSSGLEFSLDMLDWAGVASSAAFNSTHAFNFNVNDGDIVFNAESGGYKVVVGDGGEAMFSVTRPTNNTAYETLGVGYTSNTSQGVVQLGGGWNSEAWPSGTSVVVKTNNHNQSLDTQMAFRFNSNMAAGLTWPRPSNRTTIDASLMYDSSDKIMTLDSSFATTKGVVKSVNSYSSSQNLVSGELAINNHVIIMTTSGTTLTLPPANTNLGREFIVANTSGGTVTMATAGGDNIVIAPGDLSAGTSRTYVSDGISSWVAIT